jgi:hypothetical protein
MYLQHVKYKSNIGEQKSGVKVCFTIVPCKTNEIEFVWSVMHMVKMRTKDPVFTVGCMDTLFCANVIIAIFVFYILVLYISAII